MTRDPYLEMRRQLAAEAYQWRKKAMTEAKPRLEVVPEPTAEAESPVRPIVVGYDGTAGALPALRWALSEAGERSVPLIIVRAWQWDEELAGPGLVEPSDQLADQARTTLPDWARDVPGTSVVLASGAAGPAIVEQSVDAAMVVVGRRRLGPLQRAWLGSTSAYVVRHAPCPAVVVPETTESSLTAVASVAGQEHDGSTSAGNPN